MKQKLIVLGLVAMLTSCNGNGGQTVDTSDFLAPSLNVSQPVFYGSNTPTLYQDMPTEQQNAVVSLCYDYYDFCFCTGTVISPHVVLTAAHCILGEDGALTADDVVVKVGANNTNSKASKILSVSEATYYTTKDGENYLDNENYGLDIAVLILNQTDEDLTPIDIQTGEIDALIGNDVQAVGFGRTEQYLTNPSNDNRIRHWTTLDAMGFATFGQIAVHGHGETGMAPGDSGSPLLFDFGSGIRVVGVASTSEEDAQGKWVYGSYYTPVDNHESWIRSFVNQYDNPTCQAACKTVECGTVNGCSCGGCGRGQQCGTNNKCEQKPSGDGGVCFDVNFDYSSYECKDQADCAAGTYCYKNQQKRYSRCLSKCAPEACSTAAPNSFCVPIALTNGGYVNLCVESANKPCSEEYESCTTTDGKNGTCLDLYGDGSLGCFSYCNNVETCQLSEYCMDFDRCDSICLNKKCGDIDGCNCGTCKTGMVCWEENYTCVYPDEEDTDTEVDSTDEKNGQVSTDSGKDAKKKGCNSSGGVPAAWVVLGCLLMGRKKSIMAVGAKK